MANNTGRPPSSSSPLSAARPLLLASGSPRRRDLLEGLGVPLVVSPVDVDEAVLPGEGPEAYLARVVASKLAAASALFGGAAAEVAGASLVADTSVIDAEEILGKPRSREEGEAMIARLAGRAHEVWTRFAIGAAEPGGRALEAATVKTRVVFRPLSAAQVRAYVASGEGVDKAGGYAIQGRGAGLVSRVEGSYTNVVGLPACEVWLSLERHGLWA